MEPAGQSGWESLTQVGGENSSDLAEIPMGVKRDRKEPQISPTFPSFIQNTLSAFKKIHHPRIWKMLFAVAQRG